MISEQPFLFVIFALTTDDQVICVTESKKPVLPRYEFQPNNESEAITNALKRQIQEDTDYDMREVDLTNWEVQHTAKGKRRDILFRVCCALECVRRETEQSAQPVSPFPFVQWAQEKTYKEKFEPFEVWNARRIARCETEKNKIILIPFNEWHDMVERGEVTDTLSVAATEIAEKWIALVKPPSFPRKNKLEKPAEKKP